MSSPLPPPPQRGIAEVAACRKGFTESRTLQQNPHCLKPLAEPVTRASCTSASQHHVATNLKNTSIEGVMQQLTAAPSPFDNGVVTVEVWCTPSVTGALAKMLFVVFVDFKKAFDRVRRDLLLERCRELGIHGEFLDLLVKMYGSLVVLRWTVPLGIPSTPLLALSREVSSVLYCLAFSSSCYTT
jgi:hypothetical protein